MSWNYRVVRRTNETTGEESYCVHSVYYSENGDINSWTGDGESPYGETLGELVDELDRFKRATRMPVLEEYMNDDGQECLREVSDND